MDTIVIIPTYNERENVAALTEQITALNASFHVLVIDDSSSDGTGPDFSHDPSELESLVTSSTLSDVVIGSRYVEEGRIESRPWFRRALSLTANRLARLAIGQDLGDWTSGYRCYRRHVLEKLPIKQIRSNGYSFLVEVLASRLELGCSVTEVPITFVNRRSGRSKLSRVEIYKGMSTLLRLALKRAFSSVRGGRDVI